MKILSTALLTASLAVPACDCGDDSGGPDGDADADADSDGDGDGDGDSDADADGDGDGNADADCGGTPCASFEGEQEFRSRPGPLAVTHGVDEDGVRRVVLGYPWRLGALAILAVRSLVWKCPSRG